VVGRTCDRLQPIPLNIRAQLTGGFRDDIDRQLDAASMVASEAGLLLTPAEQASETDDLPLDTSVGIGVSGWHLVRYGAYWLLGLSEHVAVCRPLGAELCAARLR
jgi:hypothetical protein